MKPSTLIGNRGRVLVAMLSLYFLLSVNKLYGVQIQPGDIIMPQADTTSRILVIDPTTGDRTVFSAYPNVGSGPDFYDPSGVALLPNGDLLMCELEETAGLYEINHVTGDRTFISGLGSGLNGFPPSRGDGPLDLPRAVTVAQNGSIYLVNQDGFITQVDPSTGNRTLVSGEGVGTGPDFQYLDGGIMNTQGHLLVSDTMQAAIFDVNLQTGARTIVSGLGRGAGPTLDDAGDLTLLPNGEIAAQVVRVHDDNSITSEIVLVDQATGNRSLLFSAIWTDTDFAYLTTSADGKILGSLDVPSGEILSIDPTTGDTTLISGENVGTGADLAYGDMIVVPVPEPTTGMLGIFGFLMMGLATASRYRQQPSLQNDDRRTHRERPQLR
ncbi:MAG TPA: hypothetical protein VMJ32_17745 [Pirellulales bacterium]|nr:hypothetical protein [Pirellulales bacterium]